MSEISKLLGLSSEDLETAEFLYEAQRYRPCVSRAYYSMFYAAQALLLSESLDTSTHKRVIKLINQHFANTGKLSPNVAKLLKNAYDLRQSGDYSIDFVADEIVADKALADAKTFIAEIRAILASNN